MVSMKASTLRMMINIFGRTMRTDINDDGDVVDDDDDGDDDDDDDDLIESIKVFR